MECKAIKHESGTYYITVDSHRGNPLVRVDLVLKNDPCMIRITTKQDADHPTIGTARADIPLEVMEEAIRMYDEHCGDGE